MWRSPVVLALLSLALVSGTLAGEHPGGDCRLSIEEMNWLLREADRKSPSGPGPGGFYRSGDWGWKLVGKARVVDGRTYGCCMWWNHVGQQQGTGFLNSRIDVGRS